MFFSMPFIIVNHVSLRVALHSLEQRLLFIINKDVSRMDGAVSSLREGNR